MAERANARTLEPRYSKPFQQHLQLPRHEQHTEPLHADDVLPRIRFAPEC